MEFIRGIKWQAFDDLDFIRAVINVTLLDPGRSGRSVYLAEGVFSLVCSWKEEGLLEWSIIGSENGFPIA